MYYKLHENIRLRGWQQLPFAAWERPLNRVHFLNKAYFETLSLCNGHVDFDSVFATDENRSIARDLLEKGVIVPCEFGDDIAPIQEYRCFDNRYIKTAHWSITGKCNYRCRHCYMAAPEAKLGELSHEVCVDLIDQMAACGIQSVSLTGGEPLVRKDFYELLDHLVQHEIDIVALYSNGRLVNDRLLDELEARGLRPVIDMSFDGVGYHDWLRGIEGAEEDVNRAFALCARRGFPTRSELCLHKKNAHVFRESINHLADLGVASIKVNPVAMTDSWALYGEDCSLSMAETFDLYLDYIPHFFEDGMPTGLMLGGLFMGRKGSEKYLIPARRFNGDKARCESQTVCAHARHTLYLSPEGRMLPCMALAANDIQNDYPLATEIGLQKGLTDSTYLSLIDTKISAYFEHNPECAACEHRYICAGGCRASALFDGGTDIMGKDPAYCLIHRGGYIERVREAAQRGLAAR